MKIFSIYQDFFRFLEKITDASKTWELYDKTYYRPNQDFLETYFARFPLIDAAALKQRVEAIKPSDYSHLQSLVSSSPPERIIKDAYKKCRTICPPTKEPTVYLFIGFFSPDAFVMDLMGHPVIGFGLERFKDFRLLKILFAHEYAHLLLTKSPKGIPEENALEWLLVSEGLATFFSSQVFPERSLSDHLLFRRDTLNWCLAHEDLIREIFTSEQYSEEELLDIYHKGSYELGIPPRAAKYLGYLAVVNHPQPLIPSDLLKLKNTL